MEQNFNHVLLCGQVLTQPQPSHVNHGQSFSRFLLSVPRLSGQEDCLPVIVPQPLLELCPLSPGTAVTVTGQLRSFNNRSGQGPRLVISVFAHQLTLGGESVAGASAGGFLLTLLCALAQGLTVLVPPLLQCYLALSMACCICAETGLGSFCKAVGRALEKLLGWAGKLLVALLGLERISTLQLDRAALRTGQFLTGTVPIIGETLRDASETVLSCLQLLKSGLGLAALLSIAAEFVPVYLGMLVQLGLLSGCGLLCGLMGSERCQNLLECFAEALRCMMAVTALFAGLAIAGTALLFVVGGG